MQNENAGKTVEQIAAELNPYRKDAHSYDPWEKGFETGYTTAQQPQPMWREIEYGVKYQNVILKKGNETQVVLACYGQDVQVMGYTHYLSSDDLLRLPTEKK